MTGARPEDRSDPTPVGPAAAASLVLHHLDQGRRVATVLPVDATGDAPTGLRLVVGADGTQYGSLGDPGLDQVASRFAREALAQRPPPQGLLSVAYGGVERSIYLEIHDPTPELIIVGAGHIAQPLCAIGDLLGFRVQVLDDRPEFAVNERFPQAHRVVRVDFAAPFDQISLGVASHVVLVTRGHKYDFECLRRLLSVEPAPSYIGMIGSRRRVRATFAQLFDEGVSRERLKAVRAPLGLDLGAQSPSEIAVAVGAELVQTWRGGTGQPLSQRERILERYFPQ